MSFAIWALIIGVLMITMALTGSLLKRLPISPSMLYLAVGYGLGSAGWGLMTPDPRFMPGLLERVAEQAITLTLATVAVSIVVHGISVTPLMDLYARRKRSKSRQNPAENRRRESR